MSNRTRFCSLSSGRFTLLLALILLASEAVPAQAAPPAGNVASVSAVPVNPPPLASASGYMRTALGNRARMVQIGVGMAALAIFIMRK